MMYGSAKQKMYASIYVISRMAVKLRAAYRRESRSQSRQSGVSGVALLGGEIIPFLLTREGA